MLRILHTPPPYFAVKYVDLQDPPISYELHIDMSETTASLDILERILYLAKYYSVSLYTNIPTSDSDAPCGCQGYDQLCEYHRCRDTEIAPCFCCMKLKTVCSYHGDFN
jgi:hypothetical protein